MGSNVPVATEFRVECSFSGMERRGLIEGLFLILMVQPYGKLREFEKSKNYIFKIASFSYIARKSTNNLLLYEK